MPHVLRVENLVKKLAGKSVLAGVNLSLRSGSLFFVLGAPASGKTTLLRIIAGTLLPDSGEVSIQTDAAAPSPAKVSFLSQRDSLWPQMSVRENVSFPLEQQGLDHEEARAIAQDMLVRLGLDSLGARRPRDLSACERQRAALARALVTDPAVLLLDEPFGMFDAATRQQLWHTLRQQCAATGLTILCATQHIADALAHGTLAGVLHSGTFQHIAPPAELYRRPATRHTGEFLSNANVIEGTILFAGAGEFIAQTPLGEIRGALNTASTNPPAGTRLDILIRPESLHLDPLPPDENAFAGKVTGGDFYGMFGVLRFLTNRGDTVLRVAEQNPRIAGGGYGTGDLFAWVAPEDVTGIIRDSAPA